MATLADELLNDFEDDAGDEEEEDVSRDLLNDDGVTNGVDTTGKAGDANGIMELDGDEEEMDHEDEEAAFRAVSSRPAEAFEDAEEAKARVDKMQLGSVSDVRSVAGLMKTLKPVLEVSSSLPSESHDLDLQPV